MSLPRIAGIVVLGAALAGCEPAKPEADSTLTPGADAISPPAEDAAAGDTGGAEDGSSDGGAATDGAATDGDPPADGAATDGGAPSDGADASPASVDELLAQLSDDARREQAATALAAHGAEAAEALRTALGSENPRVRAAAAFALSQMGPTADPARADLERLAAEDEDEVVRDAARFALDALAAPGP